MNPNLLIEASAGTGKTQALAERLIELVRAGLRPQEIVALTFSRAAAGEIFERFVSLLADRAAASPRNARQGAQPSRLLFFLRPGAPCVPCARARQLAAASSRPLPNGKQPVLLRFTVAFGKSPSFACAYLAFFDKICYT